MSNPLWHLLSFLPFHFFGSQSAEGQLNGDHDLNQSSQPSSLYPSSPPIETTSSGPNICLKQDQLTITIYSDFPSTSSTSSLSSSPEVELSKKPAAPPWKKPTFENFSISTSTRSELEHPLPNQITSTPSLDPISDNLREQDLGRHVLVLVIPIVIYLLTSYNPLNVSIYNNLPVIFLCIGFSAIWNGILLRRVFRHKSNAIEIFGISLILLAFYVIIALFLPPYEIWIPFLCWILSLVPFLVGCFYKRRNTNCESPGGTIPQASAPPSSVVACEG